MKTNFQFKLCPTCKAPMVKGKGRVDLKCSKCDTKVFLDAATNPDGKLLPLVVHDGVASIYDYDVKPEWFKDSN